ncbi:MAG: RelA/SpoT family protein [bacterium]|nr:RelA/SpoT family protein [bacterium]
MDVKRTNDKILNDILKKMRETGHAEANLALIKRTYEFATEAHKDQKRKSGEPYIVHPLAVAERLTNMKLDKETIAAGLLHDTVEDTERTIDDIRKNFGDEIAFLVEGVTKLDQIRYKGTERNAENLRKMFLAVAEDIRVVLIKLADRQHNMETLEHVAPEKKRRIALETLEIYAPLAYRLGIGETKGQLEDLAFPYIYPQEHSWLKDHTKDTFEDRKNYIERLIPVVKNEFSKEGLYPIDIHARAKHYYSLYKKLLAHGMDIDKIHDLIAVRVVVKNIEDCYKTLGAIHKLWKPIPGRIKDYIAIPKPNGYRSLHTTIFGPEGKMTEFQIRTLEMHQEAENGITAHWAYSEAKTESPKNTPSFSGIARNKNLAWVQQLREWHKEFQNPEEFLESLKIDFFKNRIFVFTPKGEVLDLPEGATPVDFAYQVHSTIGDTAAGAKVNSKMVSLDYRLSSGDVVEILTQKNKRPNQDWLEFVKTSGARKKITTSIRKGREHFAFAKKTGSSVELRLNIKDRIGLLKDVSQVISDQKINMKSVTSETKNRLYPLIVIQISVKTKPSLEKLIFRLKKVNGVEEINYKLA